MLNLLGDMWPTEETAPDWLPIFTDRESFLHHYGKRHARGRRKMGHVNVTGSSIDSCIERAEALKAELLGQAGRS
jgi:5-(carboxyamino)imidazole ribonucleotide synthase